MLRSIEIKPWFLRFVLYEHFSSSLSFGPKSLGHGSRRAAQPPPTMLGHGSAVRESILGHGSAARKICWVTEVQYEKYPGARKCSTKKYPGARKTTATRLRRLLSRQVPAGLSACCALPCPSLISIHTPPKPRTHLRFGPRQATCVIAS